MKVIILTAMVATICFPVLAQESQSEILSLEVASKPVIAVVERNNREIMSSFKSYTQISNQKRLHDLARIQKQYNQYIKNK